MSPTTAPRVTTCAPLTHDCPSHGTHLFRYHEPLVDLTSHVILGAVAIVVTLASAALDTLAEDALWRLLIRPLGRLNEPIDRAFMMRLRRPLPWVAPRACATSARLTAR
eukprot:scaffold49194_cov67-Phaeocystis_antarctica.AAC.2